MTMIVLAVDGSPQSTSAALRLVERPFLLPPLVVHIVHVSPVVGRTGLHTAEFQEENRQEADRAFKAANAVLVPVASEVHLHWMHGDAAIEVTRFASEVGADVIALGAKGRGAVSSAIVGSVASGIIQRATVPVIVFTTVR
ncbi:nucleotide-binding universal stress UspA family protein [Paraburkholderia sp. GAS448]|uniref:universal stress protein n=1 Tax=Paraburkholderia sp. GAS448 TaxID=3035136 RepID=UPI003D1B641E